MSRVTIESETGRHSIGTAGLLAFIQSVIGQRDSDAAGVSDETTQRDRRIDAVHAHDLPMGRNSRACL